MWQVQTSLSPCDGLACQQEEASNRQTRWFRWWMNGNNSSATICRWQKLSNETRSLWVLRAQPLASKNWIQAIVTLLRYLSCIFYDKKRITLIRISSLPNKSLLFFDQFWNYGLSHFKSSSKQKSKIFSMNKTLYLFLICTLWEVYNHVQAQI